MREGREAYLEANGHNLKEPRIYTESGYCNEEWKTLREFIQVQAYNG